MSIEEALIRVKKKYEEYHARVLAGDPSAQDQLKDAELRGIVRGLELAVKAMEGDDE